MKHLLTLLCCNLLVLGMQAQSLIGAWEHTSSATNGEHTKQVLIFTDGYFSNTIYGKSSGAFVKSSGGSWHLQDGVLTQHLEFDTETPRQIGTDVHTKVSVDDHSLTVNEALQFKRIDSGTPGQLQGAYLMSGRVVDGKNQIRDTSGSRKTMKILSGTRFQWIAYHTDSKEFMGTGGGTYTTEAGVYTETIEFFSRDVSRVGNSLQFDYELVDGHWQHSGLSSKGDPIHEIWGLRK
ncbi:membrane or secreted protein [Gelidibacter salicanalis]|uniref:Membrane or secreted protein n=1 Tax=Gelidibacter salicanalis TaxID=291193 RepID=A0A5C7APP0_9FLAO|nr:membrane or secreted protein [Gelidibacter salicanalis]TXE10740.1 membrane or secreted protein [Gelidibacter salicanalis]